MKRKMFLKYMLVSLAVFVSSVAIAIVTRMILVSDMTFFHFSDQQASLVVGMLDGLVGAISVGIVVFQLRAGDEIDARNNDIEEAKFIFRYNQAFIQDSNMCEVEHQLENAMIDQEGASLLIDDNNRQMFVNYLVYLEGLAPLVLRDVLKLEHIDDLMAYRFFLAMNNPVLQKDQLFAFPEYYRGCFKLYRVWKEYREERKLEILMPKTALDLWVHFEEYNDCPFKVREALPTDKLEDVAALIYGTDPYIYPAAFGSVSRAKRYLPKIICAGNSIFGIGNILVAMQENEIVGIAVVLSDQTKETFDYAAFQRRAHSLPKSFSHTAENYFTHLKSYIPPDDSRVYISCICVKDKMRGNGIGDLLIKAIKKKYTGRDLYLHVLTDNKTAVALYQKHGFEIVKVEDGYALTSPAPTCYLMKCGQAKREI